MKLKFKYQQFQRDAARAVTDVFRGQQRSDGFTYRMDQGNQADFITETGIRNEPIQLAPAMLLDNIRTVQRTQELKPSEQIAGEDLRLTIEMETGTGKTYTYIKTMFELNKLYGWSKFIIVVPSVAIREGVKKSFEIMQDHFVKDYGKRIQFFIYNSTQLTQIDFFASDANMCAMIINTQAFNARGADARRIYMELDSFRSRRPIDVIAATRPILIIDEPQSVLGSNKSNATRQRLQEFNPLFILLYSATHRKEDIYNMVYRLDAMDAYNKKLVKKICVKGIEQIGTTATNGYLYLEQIVIGKGNPQARLSFDMKTQTGTKQTTRLVSEGFNVKEHSGGLAEYDNHFIIERIDGFTGTVRFLNGLELHEGDVIGNINEDILRRIQIRETISSHIEREQALFKKGIKVLSLFFIDHVENYRQYGTDGTSNGKYAEMFEEEYMDVLQNTIGTLGDGEYIRYLQKHPVKKIHQGYFSKDKKGNFVDSKLERGTSDSNDEAAYDLIMKNKERLLSFEEPVRFIFSHSALKEGWDNPNVFQICTLKNSDNETKKRQEVGRGMRLCVNKKGERQDEEILGNHVFDINVLTIIASESYANFSRQLQSEIAEAVANRPVDVTATLFIGRTITYPDSSQKELKKQDAIAIQEQLVTAGYVRKGKLTDKYFNDKRNNQLDLGEYNEIKESVIKILDTVFNPQVFQPENARNTKEAHFDAEKFHKKEFQSLWKKINTRTFYTVDFDTDELIQKSITSIDKLLNVTKVHIVIETGILEKIENKEALHNATAMSDAKARTIQTKETVSSHVKYDLIGKLVEETGLTRKAIIHILQGIRSDTFHQFQLNPEEFIIKVGKLINEQKALAVIQHISYHKLDQTFDTDIFTETTLKGKLGINALESVKSLYDLVVVDSVDIEKSFAEALEKQQEVVVYTKLPPGFYINTPVGHYNPDWAIAFQEGSVKHIYFVVETKGSLESAQLRPIEEAKIECARRHFETICNNEIKYSVVMSYRELKDILYR